MRSFAFATINLSQTRTCLLSTLPSLNRAFLIQGSKRRANSSIILFSAENGTHCISKNGSGNALIHSRISFLNLRRTHRCKLLCSADKDECICFKRDARYEDRDVRSFFHHTRSILLMQFLHQLPTAQDKRFDLAVIIDVSARATSQRAFGLEELRSQTPRVPRQRLHRGKP